MRSGTKNTVVDIMRHSSTIDPDYNQPVTTLVAWKSGVFCRSESRRSQERDGEGQVVAQSIKRFLFDYFDIVGILELDVIRMDGADYVVTGLYGDDNEKQDYMVEAVHRMVATATVP